MSDKKEEKSPELNQKPETSDDNKEINPELDQKSETSDDNKEINPELDQKPETSNDKNGATNRPRPDESQSNRTQDDRMSEGSKLSSNIQDRERKRISGNQIVRIWEVTDTSSWVPLYPQKMRREMHHCNMIQPPIVDQPRRGMIRLPDPFADMTLMHLHRRRSRDLSQNMMVYLEPQLQIAGEFNCLRYCVMFMLIGMLAFMTFIFFLIVYSSVVPTILMFYFRLLRQ